MHCYSYSVRTLGTRRDRLISGSGHPLLQGVVRRGRFQKTDLLHSKPEDDRQISTNRRRFGAEMQALLHDSLIF